MAYYIHKKQTLENKKKIEQKFGMTSFLGLMAFLNFRFK